jgi:hypothetical protein
MLGFKSIPICQKRHRWHRTRAHDPQRSTDEDGGGKMSFAYRFYALQHKSAQF